jgi:hypothetical protein
MATEAQIEQQFIAQKPGPDYSWTEPPSDWNVSPPLNRVIGSESGHFIEMDDTPEFERVRIQHRTGTFTEIQANGQQIVKILGDKYEIIASNNNVLINGVCNITVQGDSVFNVVGDCYSQVNGDSYQQVNGKTKINSGEKVEITSGGDISLFAGGELGTVSIRAASAVNINSDLNVSGSIISKQSVSAVENVTAGMKLSSNLGIDTLGPIFGAVSLWTPLTQGAMVRDTLGTMMTMRMQYNSHIHKAPKGPTSTPLRKML